MLGAVGGRKAPNKSWLALWFLPTEIRLLSSFPGLALSMLQCTCKIVWLITREPMEPSLKANSSHVLALIRERRLPKKKEVGKISCLRAGFPLHKNMCVQCKGTHPGDGLISIAVLLPEAGFKISFHRGLPKPLFIHFSSSQKSRLWKMLLRFSLLAEAW